MNCDQVWQQTPTWHSPWKTRPARLERPLSTLAQRRRACPIQVKAQVFETVEAIEARSAWNAIVPRKTRSQPLSTGMPSLQLQGISANLHAGDVLLLIASGTSKALRFIQNVVVDTVAQQTTVFLEAAILPDIP